jgi:O-antigen ligase
MIKNSKVLFYFFPIAIAFVLPFGNAISSPLIALWFVSSLFNLKRLFVKQNTSNKWFLTLIAFFVLTLISNFLFYNSNDPFGSVEIKLSFLFMPVLVFLFQTDYGVARRTIAGFVSGCLFATLACVGRSLMYLFNGDSSYMYYSKFSYFMHSAYFAMYLNLALVFVLLFYFKWFKGNSFYKYFAYFLIGLFTLGVFLCASKIGIITLFILIPLVLIMEYRQSITLKHYTIAFATLLVFTTSVYLIIPQVFDRLRSVSVVTETHIDKTATESSSVRVLIWNECVEIIKSNFVTGVGVSNANETLYASYEANGLTGAFEKKLNAHNQYFQTFIGMGIFGFIVLLILTIGLAVYAVIKKNNLLLFFALLTSVNFLVESMLQTSAGTVFYVFFLCFLIVFEKDKLSNEVV